MRYPKKFSHEIEKYSGEYNIPQSLIFAIIKAESNFNPNALSYKGAIGLMQIMPNTAKFILDNRKANNLNINLEDADTNICIGTKYLRYLTDKYSGILIEVLAAYNAGEGIVMRWKIAKNGQLSIDDIEYDETKNYVRKVLKYKNYYEKLYNLK